MLPTEQQDATMKYLINDHWSLLVTIHYESTKPFYNAMHHRHSSTQKSVPMTTMTQIHNQPRYHDTTWRCRYTHLTKFCNLLSQFRDPHTRWPIRRFQSQWSITDFMTPNIVYHIFSETPTLDTLSTPCILRIQKHEWCFFSSTLIVFVVPLTCKCWNA